MARSLTEIEIAAPRDFCFDFVLNFDNAARWDPLVKRGEQITSYTPPRVGSKFVLHSSTFGISNALPYEIVEVKKDALIALVGQTAIFGYRDEIRFTDLEGGRCRMTYDADFNLRGIFRIGSPLMGLVFNQIGKTATRDIARTIEAAAASN